MVVSKWEIKWTPTFTNLYRAKDELGRRRTREVIDVLARSPNPLREGERLHNLGYFAARISKAERIGYYMEGKTIYLLKVCDHKEVEGRD